MTIKNYALYSLEFRLPQNLDSPTRPNTMHILYWRTAHYDHDEIVTTLRLGT